MKTKLILKTWRTTLGYFKAWCKPKIGKSSHVFAGEEDCTLSNQGITQC